MSFSAELRHELVSLPAAKSCCMAAELSALTACLASMSLRGQGRVQLVYETRSAGVLRRIFSLLKQRYAIKGVPSLTNLSRFGGVKLYQLRLTVEDSRVLLLGLAPDHRGGMQRLGLPSVPKRVVRRICCRRAWIRGAFLACGSIGDPRRGYRAEFVLDDAPRADYLEKLLKLSGVESLRAMRRGSEVAMGGDGQVSLGETIMKGNAVKVRRLAEGAVLAGFAGAVADAFALFDRFEGKLKEYQKNLLRAAVELGKEWRTDKYLRQLNALLAVCDRDRSLIISGSGEIIEPEDGLIGIGSGGAYALAAARALVAHTDLSAAEIVRESLRIAASICVYTNDHVVVDTLSASSPE